MEVALIALAATLVSSAYYTKENMDNQKKAIKENNQYTLRTLSLEKQQADSALAEQQRKNKNLLAQQQASYKAKLGAGGIPSYKDSAQTYLNALQKEYDMEDKYLQNQAKLSAGHFLNNLNHTNTSNLLKLNTLNNQETTNSYSGLGNLVNGMGRTMIK